MSIENHLSYSKVSSGGRGGKTSETVSSNDISLDRVLFIDDAQVQSMRGVERRIHPGRKFEGNPVLAADREWETGQLIVGTVLRENGVDRMWYTSSTKGQNSHMYAESENGRDWTLPSLGLYDDPAGSKDNNVFLDPETRHSATASVMRTPTMGAGREYSITAYFGGSHHICFSKDGFGWTDWSEEPVIYRYGDVSWAAYDHRDELFRGMVKRFLEVRGRRRRIQNWTTSEDGFEWTLPQPAVVPDEQDDEWTGGDIHSATEIYAIPIARYGPVLLGFMDVLRATDAMGTPGVNTQGIIDIQLVSSRDGRTWERVGDRRPIVEMGQRGEFDGGFIRAAESFVEDGDELRLYYTGMDHPHGGQKKGRWQRAIGMASWPKDRLVGLHSGNNGEVATTSMPAGRELHVNADASKGQITAEVLDESGAVVSGLDGASCVPLSADSLDHVFRWADAPSPDNAPAERSVRLRLRNAEVFSVWFSS